MLGRSNSQRPIRISITQFYKKYAEECEKRYALERKLEQIMNLINA